MRNGAAALSLILALVLGACGKQSDTVKVESEPAASSAAAAELTPEQLGELGAQIEKNPGSAPDLLSQRGLDEASFEQQIRKVSSDPEASRRYRDAYVKAKA